MVRNLFYGNSVLIPTGAQGVLDQRDFGREKPVSPSSADEVCAPTFRSLRLPSANPRTTGPGPGGRSPFWGPPTIVVARRSQQRAAFAVGHESRVLPWLGQSAGHTGWIVVRSSVRSCQPLPISR